MSSPERNKQKALEWEAEQRAIDIERHRVKNLTMYARIEEFVCDEQLKLILHAITERLGMED